MLSDGKEDGDVPSPLFSRASVLLVLLVVFHECPAVQQLYS